MAIESKMSRGPIGRAPAHGGAPKKPGAWVWIVGLLAIAILGGAWFYFSERGSPSPADDSAQEAAAPIRSGEFQAVFLDNGQVYFGQLTRSRDAYWILTDVFYLQSGVAVEQTSSIALTKLGSEAHGPVDRMEINPDHVLFIEDMKEDSKVVQAIQQYKANKK